MMHAHDSAMAIIMCCVYVTCEWKDIKEGVNFPFFISLWFNKTNFSTVPY